MFIFVGGRGGGADRRQGRARNFEVSFCFGYQSPNFECDNNMNFPTLQNVLCLACSPTRSRGSPLPEGAFWGVRTLQADLRGVMRLWRCAPAPYRVCADIAKNVLPFSSGGVCFAVCRDLISYKRGHMECPPTGLDFCQTNGSSCACGAVRQHPTGILYDHSLCGGEKDCLFQRFLRGSGGTFCKKCPRRASYFFGFPPSRRIISAYCFAACSVLFSP